MAEPSNPGRPRPGPGLIDGRTARALRTREAIVDASVALVAEGDVRPTAQRVAERAGVSVRSVFQHFEDVEGLYAAVADRFVARLSDLRVTVDPALPLDRRLREIVRRRAVLLEAMTPIRRAAAVHAPFSVEVRSRLQAGHDHLRADLERLFAAELDQLDVEARRVLLDALDSTLSWSTWENLRHLNGRSVEHSRTVVELLLGRLLAPVGTGSWEHLPR